MNNPPASETRNLTSLSERRDSMIRSDLASFTVSRRVPRPTRQPVPVAAGGPGSDPAGCRCGGGSSVPGRPGRSLLTKLDEAFRRRADDSTPSPIGLSAPPGAGGRPGPAVIIGCLSATVPRRAHRRGTCTRALRQGYKFRQPCGTVY
eukprot:756506-Hanusia_phi.AAC.11